jgi:hypothetical protein
MAEETKKEDAFSNVIEVIKEDAIVSIPMSTGYYKRIQAATKFLLENKSQGVIQLAHESIKNQNITEPWVFHYETLLILCNEFEKTARNENQVTQMTKEEFEKHVTEALEADASAEELNSTEEPTTEKED